MMMLVGNIEFGSEFYINLENLVPTNNVLGSLPNSVIAPYVENQTGLS